jgi:hypothetical protein
MYMLNDLAKITHEDLRVLRVLRGRRAAQAY